MRKDRLLKLANFLETVPRKAFNLKNWQISAATKPEGDEPGDCGFAGCAIGWAAHAKLFRGFTLGPFEDWPYLQPKYKDKGAWRAVAELMDLPLDHDGGLSSRHAEHLFLGNNYAGGNPSPKQVAARIRKFVKREEART